MWEKIGNMEEKIKNGICICYLTKLQHKMIDLYTTI